MHYTGIGVLQILNPGRHILNKPTHFLAGFLPSGQQTLAIEAVTSMSADNVGIKFDSALRFVSLIQRKLSRCLALRQRLLQDNQHHLKIIVRACLFFFFFLFVFLFSRVLCFKSILYSLSTFFFLRNHVLALFFFCCFFF